MQVPSSSTSLHKKPKPASSTSSDSTSESSPCRAPTTLKGFINSLEDYVRSPDFAAFFEVKDILSLGQVCKSFRKVFGPEYVSLVIRLGNLEDCFRYLFWIHQVPYIKYNCDISLPHGKNPSPV